MSNKERVGIILDIDAEVSKAKGNISSIAKIFDGIGGNKGNQLREILSDINDEYEKLSDQSGRAMSKVGDFTKAEKSSERLNQLLRKIDKEMTNIGKTSDKDLSKFFPAEISERIKKASDAIKTYNSIIENSSKNKGIIGLATTEYNNQEKAVKKAAQALKELQDIQKGQSTKKVVTADAKITKQGEVKAANAEVNTFKAELEEAQQKMEAFKVRKAELFEKGTQNKSSEFRTLRDELATAEKNFEEAATKAGDLKRELKDMVVVGDLDADIQQAEQALKDAQNAASKLKDNLDSVKATEFSRAFDEAKKKLEGLSNIDLSEIGNIDDLNNLFERFTNEGVEGLKRALNDAGIELRELGSTNDSVEGSIRSNTAELERQNRALEDVNGIKNRILQFFSLTNAMQLGRQAIRSTIETVKELDKSMTETAVVTEFNVGDMWDQLPEYTDMARQYGVAIKGVYDASTLYYQQGLNQQQTMQLTGETLKMARIAGLEYADATNLMTAALRGFNMELNEANATRINDVYSELAAITAADTNEIATAMTKTASIAASANMEFETTAALLSQIIETTREPAETAGTAMKTIIARFTEMKKSTSEIFEVDGEEVNVNKVEAALKSAGVALRDAKGEFRDLDDVFLELSSRWNSLDIMTQRYIATTAAGSRQQSRFIAMMQNYDRTMELVDAAYSSTGASAGQFAKTQESLETKIANLEAAWQEFLMGISNSDAIKGIIDILTKLLNALNDATTGVSGFSTFALRMFSMIATFKIGKGVFNKIFANINTELFKGGQQGGQKISQGISSGIDKSIGQAMKGFAKSVPQKIKSIFQTTKIVSKIPVEFQWNENGLMGAKDFAKTITSSLSPDQIKANLPDIGATLEQSINASLERHGLADEGAGWAKELVEGFCTAIQQEGASFEAEIANLEAGLQNKIKGSKREGTEDVPLSEEDNINNQKKDNMLKNLDEGGLQVLEKAIPTTEQVKTNIMGIGTALSTAGMAANLVISALEESGAVSKKTAKTIKSLSNGLSTAGTLMMTLKAASDMFNISANMNPYILAISAIIAGVTIFCNLLNQAKERQKEINEEAMELADQSSEETASSKDSLDKYNELLKTYKETGEETEELKLAREELIEAFELENSNINVLTASYWELAEAAEAAMKAKYATDAENQGAAANGAFANLWEEGKSSWGGTGFMGGGSSFNLSGTSSDDFAAMSSFIIQELEKAGIEGATVSGGGISGQDIQISGIGTDPESQRKFFVVLNAAMQSYASHLKEEGKDASQSGFYGDYSAFYGANSDAIEKGLEYANQMIESAVNSILDQAELEGVESYEDFETQYEALYDAMVEQYGDTLTEEQIENAILNALNKSDNPVVSDYARAKSKAEGMYESEEIVKQLPNLTNQELRLFAQLEFDQNATWDEIQQILNEKKFEISVFGDAELINNLASYSEKLTKGEATQEDKDEVYANLADVGGVYHGMSAQDYWKTIQNSDNSTQLKFLGDVAKEEYDAAQEKRESLLEDVKVLDFTQASDAYSTFHTEQSEKISAESALEGRSSSDIQTDIDTFKSLKTTLEGALAEAESQESAKDNALDIVSGIVGGVLGGAADFFTGGASGGAFTVLGTAGGMALSDYIDGIVTTSNEEFITTTKEAIESADGKIEELEAEKETAIANEQKVASFNEKYKTKDGKYTSQGKLLNADVKFFSDEELANVGDLSTEEVMQRYQDTYSHILLKNVQANLLGSEGVFGGAEGFETMATDFSEAFEGVKLDLTDISGMLEKINQSGADQSVKDTWTTKLKEIDKWKQQLEKNGIELDWSKDPKELKKDLEKKIGDLEAKLTVETDSEEIDKLKEQLEALEEYNNDMIVIQAAVDAAELDAALALMRQLTAEAQNMSNAASLIEPITYQVDAESFRQLMAMAPELLENHKVLTDGKIQLDKKVVQEALKNKEIILKQELAQAQAEVQNAQKTADQKKAVLMQMLLGEVAINEETASEIITVKANQAQAEQDMSVKQANTAADASSQMANQVINNYSQIYAAVDLLGTAINSLNKAIANDTEYQSKGDVESAFAKIKGSYTEIVATKSQTIDITEYQEGEGSRRQKERQAFATWLQTDEAKEYVDSGGNVDYEKAAQAYWGIKTDENGNVIATKAGTTWEGAADTEAGLKAYNQVVGLLADMNYWDQKVLDASATEAEINAALAGVADARKQLENGDGSGGSGGSGGSKDKDKNYTNPSLENIEADLENLERRRENGEINAGQYQLEKKGLLTLKQGYLQKEFENALATSKEKKYFQVDDDGVLKYNDAEYKKLDDDRKNEVDTEFKRLQEINKTLLDVNSELGKMIPTIQSIAKADAVIEATERSYKNREMNAIEYEQTNEAALAAKYQILQHNLDYELENNAERDYFYYDEKLDTILLNEEMANELNEEQLADVEKEYQKVKEINDEMNKIEDELADLEFLDPEDERRYYAAEARNISSENELEYIERQRNLSNRYKDMTGKLPEEVQGPINLVFTGYDAALGMQELYEYSNIRTNEEEQLRAKWNDSQYKDLYIWNERTQSLELNEEEYSKPELDKSREEIDKNFQELQDHLKAWKDAYDKTYGGPLQDGARKVGKALTEFAKDVADNNFDGEISEISTGFDKLDEAINNFIKKLSENEFIDTALSKTVISGLNLSDEQKSKILGNEQIAGLIAENPEFAALIEGVMGAEGASLGTAISGILGPMGAAITAGSAFMNPETIGFGLDIFNGVKGMAEQISSKIEELIGYITQATQVIIDAWTNREDYLYNFLNIIEKHLQEYEKLQREDNQFQKGRTASVEDIKRNWNEQWKSLQTQLEEQQERLETRQQELDRSRWNPFQLISGWDPTSDTLYENREVKFLWDVIIGLGEAFAPFGTGAFFSQLNQLYEDYDQRVQNSYEDRLAAEQAILDIEDQRLDLVKAGAEEATQFEEKVLDALIQKEQEQIDELTRLNEAITDANSKLISTLQNNLEKIRQDRENEKKEEELSEKQRRLSYLRQDTSGANMMEIKKLEEELEEGHEDYTDTLIDQKISELQDQNDKAAEQRQQQIELLQAQLDWNEKYGLYWDTIYGMLYTFDENGNVILKPENFDIDGNIRENSELAQMLGTFSDRIGMSTWSAVLDSEELKLLGKYYGAFVGVNGVDGDWKHQWALDDPGADDPNYAYPEQEIPEGVWGVLYSMEIMFKKYFVNSNLGIANSFGRADEAFKTAFGKLFGNEEWANYNFEGYKAEQVQSTFFAGLKEASDNMSASIAKIFETGEKTTRSVAFNSGGNQNYGDTNINNTFTIGTVGENISLDDMVDKVSNAIKGMFTSPINGLQRSR